MSEQGLKLADVARKIGVSARTLERRHELNPPFPKPILRKPLVWREADIDAWIVRASRERNAA